MATWYAAVARLLYPSGHRVSIPGVVAGFGVVIYGNHRVLRGNPVFQHPSAVQQQRPHVRTAWFVGAYVVLSGVAGAYYLKQMHEVNMAFRP